MPPSSKGTIIVTGPAGGIGGGWVLEHLKSEQAKLYHTIYVILPRAPGNLKETIDGHAPEGHSYEIVPVDLSKQSEIRAFAKNVNRQIAEGELGRIRLMLLIAGAMFMNRNSSDGLSFTEDGIESTFAVNYLSNFLLVLLLLQAMDSEWARVVWIASYSHDTHLWISRKTFPTVEERIVFKGEGTGDVERLAKQTMPIKKGDEFPASVRRYGISKLCMAMWMYELQRRLNLDPKLSHITIIAHDPGTVFGTALTNTMPWYIRLLMQYMLVPVQIIWSTIWTNGAVMRTPAVVGKDLVWCCWDEQVLGKKETKGVYLNGKALSDSSLESHEVRKQKDLWRGSLECVGLKEGETVLKNWN